MMNTFTARRILVACPHTLKTTTIHLSAEKRRYRYIRWSVRNPTPRAPPWSCLLSSTGQREVQRAVLSGSAVLSRMHYHPLQAVNTKYVEDFHNDKRKENNGDGNISD